MALIPYVDDLQHLLPNKEMVMLLRLIWSRLRCCERYSLRQVCRGFADLQLGYDPKRCERWRTAMRRLFFEGRHYMFVII